MRRGGFSHRTALELVSVRRASEKEVLEGASALRLAPEALVLGPRLRRRRAAEVVNTCYLPFDPTRWREDIDDGFCRECGRSRCAACGEHQDVRPHTTGGVCAPCDSAGRYPT